MCVCVLCVCVCVCVDAYRWMQDDLEHIGRRHGLARGYSAELRRPPPPESDAVAMPEPGVLDANAVDQHPVGGTARARPLVCDRVVLRVSVPNSPAAAVVCPGRGLIIMC